MMPLFLQAESVPRQDVMGFLQESWPILVVCALGLAAVYLLLPRPRRYPLAAGIGVGLLAMVAAGAWLLHAELVLAETVLFYSFAGLAVLSGGVMLAQSHPVQAALAFALVVLSTCGLFLLQAAPFLMAGTIIIYAGAIIVTFLFVIMLSQQSGLSSADHRSREPLLASLAGFVLLGALLYVLFRSYGPGTGSEIAAQLDAYLPKFDKAAKVQTTALGEVREHLRSDGPPGDKATYDFVEDFLKVIDAAGKTIKGPGTEVEKLKESTEDVQGALKELLWFENDMDENRQRQAELKAELQRANVADDQRPQLVQELKAKQDDYRRLEDGPEGHRAKFALLRKDLAQVYLRGVRVQNRLFKTLQPSPDPERPLSPFSGVPPNQDPALDSTGRAHMPAHNVAALGRSLFTDYLVAVELAATLLLVATIGAIAIAGRRTEGLR